jgi:hypothetical protein
MMPIVLVFAGIVVAVGLFFLFRKIFLWYFRINEIVDLLEKQNSLMQELVKNSLNKIR